MLVHDRFTSVRRRRSLVSILGIAIGFVFAAWGAPARSGPAAPQVLHAPAPPHAPGARVVKLGGGGGPQPQPPKIFTATLNGPQVVPPSSSGATGSGSFVLDTTAHTLSYNVSFTGLQGVEVGAHIHGPAAIGVNGGILFALPLGSPASGVVTTTLAQEAAIQAELSYVDIHSAAFPGGEIRGQIVRVPSCVPAGALVPQAEPQIFCNVVPAAWQAEDVQWSGDVQPHNKIDDELDAGGGLRNIVVSFRRVLTAEQSSFLEALSSTSAVSQVCRYIPSISMTNVSAAEIAQIASRPDVAFIEKQPVFVGGASIHAQNIKVQSSSAYPQQTVDDLFPPFLDASGIHIAIMDTGVDTGHAAFANTPFVAGFNSLTNQSGDPADDNGHGTWVASIALGGVSANSHGIAPKAGLIDIKCLNAAKEGTWDSITSGLQKLYDERQNWQVKIINMSLFAAGASNDGTEPLCQLIDLAESMGIVVVTIAGNDGPTPHGISQPGAATRSITVSGSNDNGTPTRADDGIYCITAGSDCSTAGPRADDADDDTLDELKPDVCAPGQNVIGALFGTPFNAVGGSGTSASAPQVAGLAALILKNGCPGMSPASVKQILISSATPVPGFPGISGSTWNARTGWGLVDAYAAMSLPLVADVTFPNHPANPSWESVDITTSALPPHVGQTTTVTAMIRNAGSQAAQNVRVQFGVHVYSASPVKYHDIGTRIVTVPAGQTIPVMIEWLPVDASHQCLQVELGYGQDTDCSNNRANRNLSVANSPIQFQVQNTLTAAPAHIALSVACTDGDWNGWDVRLTPSTIVLAGCDPPVDVTALAIPPLGAPAGSGIKVQIAAKIGTQVLGGVSFTVVKKDCNANSVDDYLDIQVGTSTDQNGNGVPDECDPQFPSFCFGDGTGTACPCASGAPGHGCANSTGGSGLLAASGSASVTANTLVLTATGLVPNSTALFLQGTAQQNGGLGVPSASSDGLLCVGGTIVRLGAINAIGGTATKSNVAVSGGIPASGGTRHYQVFYRNAASYCTPASMNSTNGVTVVWAAGS